MLTLSKRHSLNLQQTYHQRLCNMSLSSSSMPTFLKLLFEGILLFPVSIMGIVFNCFNIVFLWNKRNKIELTEEFRNLLILLSACDLLHLVNGIAVFAMPELSTWYSVNVYPKILWVSFGFLHVGLLGSILTTISIALERYITVCYPTTSFARKYLLIVSPIIAAIMYNIPKFFEIITCSDKELYATMLKSYLEKNPLQPSSRTVINNINMSSNSDIYPSDSAISDTFSMNQYQNISQNGSTITNIQTDQNIFQHDKHNDKELIQYLSTTDNELVVNALKLNSTSCDLYGHRMADFRSNMWYIIFYQFLSDLILVKIVPWFTIIILNFKVIIASRKFRIRRLQLLNKEAHTEGTRETRQTRILLSIAVMFVLSHCFTIVPDIHEFMCTLSEDKCQNLMYTYSVIEFGHLMLAVNSSINFFFYIFHIKLFREIFIKISCFCFKNGDENFIYKKKTKAIGEVLIESNTLLMGPILNQQRRIRSNFKLVRAHSC